LSKKTLELIVKTGNDYLVKVKANQPTLLEALQQTVEQTTPLSSMQTEEKNRGRLEKRHIDIFSPSSTIPLPEKWTSVQRIISVRREFKYQEGLHSSVSYFISSVSNDSADFFAGGIRGHWLIENQLHYVKDVNMHEDTSGIKNLVAASNLSILKNIAINIARQNCCKSIKGAATFFACNIKKLLQIIRT
jgi:predicted transposase YbfD/YdcC